MAKAMTGAQMLAACKKWKVDVHEYPGYTTRKAGAWGSAEGVMIHHVGSDASQSDNYLHFLFTQGTSVPPPLCNVATQMDGDLWLGALGGRANHAGSGSSATLSKVMSGNYDWRNSTITPGADDMNGNPHYYGNECCFDGGQPMTRAMWVTTVLWCAAVCDFHGWSAYRVIGHKEWTDRKIDPGSTSMAALRRDVHAALTAGPGNWPTPQEEDVALTPAQEAAIAKAGWLADQFAQGAQFETDLDGIDSLKTQVAALEARLANHETAVAGKLDEVVAAIKGYIDQTQQTTEASRYSHIISTLTQWAETQDNIRHDALLAKLNELHPPEEPPPLA